jgi:hypothetical protein
MSWRDQWETTGYVYSLTSDDANILRVRILAERGEVVRIAVQYETIIDGRRYPVVRYDTAHNDAHRDVLDWRGHVVQKDWIAGSSAYKRALNEAVDDLKTNWPACRVAFLEMKP